MPILIRNGSRFQSVSPLGFSNEEELEFLLSNSPDLLRDDGGPAIAFVDRQVDLREAGILDLLFVSSDGLPIAVEVKLARNAQARREVLAQAIDYISSLTALTVDELDERVNGKLEAALRTLVTEDDALRANIDETVLLVVITEQGENRNQCEEQWISCGFPHGFARRGT